MASWGMGWFGGGGAAAKKDSPKNAILGLRSTLEMLSKREKHLQNQIDEQQALARKNANSNQGAARTALRRKKAFEVTLSQTQDSMMNVEHQISSIEAANINKETLDALKNASGALKKIHGGLTVDKVDATMEDLREQQAIASEIAETLTQGALTNNPVDEDELEEELAEMQQEELDSKMVRGGTVPVGDQVDRLPTATGELHNKHTEDADEEEELRKLQAEMAM